MRHLDDGTLRRLCDEPQATTESHRRHLDACQSCQARLDAIASDAHQAAALFAARPPQLDSVAALARVRRRVATEGAAPGWRRRLTAFGEAYGRRFSRPAAGLGAAVLLVGATALTPAGSLAQQFITIFQPQQVAMVPVSSADLMSLPDLRAYGTVHQPAHVAAKQASTAAQAAALSGLTVLTPASLPSGVPAQVQYTVVPSTTGSFTFSAARTRKTLASRPGFLRTHARLLSVSKQINGSTLQVTVGESVLARYGSGTEQIPPLVVGEMKAPTISSTGASVKEMEDYVLGLPGVSPGLAQAIRSIGDPVATSTLPIPIPVDMASAHSVDVQGVKGLSIGDATGVGSVVVWEKDGIIYGVGGPITESQALATAGSLH